MYRALFEILIFVLFTVVARSVLTSLLKGVSSAARTFQDGGDPGRTAESASAGHSRREAPANELHKDPVCGTYVAQSTPYQRQAPGQVFYYCSTQCREKHALVAR